MIVRPVAVQGDKKPGLQEASARPYQDMTICFAPHQNYDSQTGEMRQSGI